MGNPLFKTPTQDPLNQNPGMARPRHSEAMSSTLPPYSQIPRCEKQQSLPLPVFGLKRHFSLTSESLYSCLACRIIPKGLLLQEN